MKRRRANGTRAGLVRELVARGMRREDAERLAPKEDAVSPRRALTPQQLAAFNSAASKVRQPAIRAILLLLPVTGLRVAEACSLRLSAVDVNGRGKLRAEVLGKAKGGRPKLGPNGRGPHGERIVYDDQARVIEGRNIGRMVDAKGRAVKAPPHLRTIGLGGKGTRIVKEYVSRSRPRGGPDLVFVGAHGGRITTGMIQAACRAISAKVGFKVVPHQLRHSFATMKVHNGWDPHAVQAALGHGKPGSKRIPRVTLNYMDFR